MQYWIGAQMMNICYIGLGHPWFRLWCQINTLRPRQNGCHFADDVLKCIFLNENVWISLKISLKCVPKGPINNIPSLVQIMVWRRPGDKPLSEPMMVNLLTHICVTRPQWLNKWSKTCILSIFLHKWNTLFLPDYTFLLTFHLTEHPRINPILWRHH